MWAYLTGFLLPLVVIVGAVLYFGWWILMLPVALGLGIIAAVCAWHWQKKHYAVKKLEKQYKL
jgi:hypothetical protein